MEKEKVKVVFEVLESQLAASEQMWKNGEIHPKIIGYLQGVIRGVMWDLREEIK